MTISKFQITKAKDVQQYIQILTDSQDFEHMTKEQYDYEMEDHIIFQHERFCVFKRYGNEFFVGHELGEEEAGFYLDEIFETKLEIKSSGELIPHWEDDSKFPSIMDYIQEAGFPVHFKVFKDYGQ